MKRDNFSQLPTSVELQSILAAEVKRNVPEGNWGVHFFEFIPLVNLLNHLEIDSTVFAQQYSLEDLEKEDVLQKGKEIIGMLKEKLLDHDHSVETISLLNEAYDYLSEEDEPKKSDIIFVFGAKTPLRIEKAIELYKQEWSEKVMISGKGPHYGDANAVTEAEIYAQAAVKQGVPEDAILIEDKSITIPDNVRSSLNLLDEQNKSFSSIILVNSPYTQRRGWAHFKKYVPSNVEVLRVNCGTGDQYKKEMWFKSAGGIDVVLGEYLKAKVAVSLNTA
jgi:uncharacterized SAM-binding protein YcdF (DUF218 family)